MAKSLLLGLGARGEFRGIIKPRVDDFRVPGENWAMLLGVAADRDHKIECHTPQIREGFGAVSGDVHARFRHHADRAGVQPVGFDSGGIGLDRFTAGGTGRWVASAQRWADKGGVWGAGLLGFVFAASFCPLSAALFFGSLVPLTVSHRSPLLLPSLYGLGTAIPAVILAVTLSVGGTLVARVYNRMSGLEKWGRRLTGGLFILVGVYLTLIHVFGVQF